MRTHRFLKSLLPTHSQSLVIIFPSFKNVNLRPKLPGSGSAQIAQVPQVTGHAAATPTNWQRFTVSLSATQEQFCEIRTPFSKMFSSKELSTQGTAVGAIDGAAEIVNEADGVGEGLIDKVGLFDGFSVGSGSIGDADGDGEGLIDIVGLFVGSSLGI